MRQKEVDIVVLGNADLETQALRSVLEVFDIHVNTYWIGQPKDFLEIFSKTRKISEYVVICGHGDECGFIFNELDVDLQKIQPWGERMTADDISKNLHCNNAHIISSGCMTGTDDIAEAFLGVDAQSYTAPTDYIKGSASIYFLIDVFYKLFGKSGIKIDEITSSNGVVDDEVSLFKTWKVDS